MPRLERATDHFVKPYTILYYTIRELNWGENESGNFHTPFENWVQRFGPTQQMFFFQKLWYDTDNNQT